VNFHHAILQSRLLYEVTEKENPMGRISTSEEYRAAVFMLSDANGFITGGDLIIDGGHRA
jgi:hypothetical protein